MANMVRWDPFREMMSLREAMDSLFENALVNPASGTQERTGWAMPLDVIENEDAFVVKASLPGINPEDLDVTVNGDILTIRGEMKQHEEEKKSGRYVMQERRWGNFSRSVSLPAPVKTDAVQADYSNGVLTLTLPKTEEVKPKKIQIKAGEQPKQMAQQ